MEKRRDHSKKSDGNIEYEKLQFLSEGAGI